MKTLLALSAVPVLMLVLFGLLGLCGIIFNGILLLINTHWIVALCVGLAVYMVATFVLRLTIEAVS